MGASGLVCGRVSESMRVGEDDYVGVHFTQHFDTSTRLYLEVLGACVVERELQLLDALAIHGALRQECLALTL